MPAAQSSVKPGLPGGKVDPPASKKPKANSNANPNAKPNGNSPAGANGVNGANGTAANGSSTTDPAASGDKSAVGKPDQQKYNEDQDAVNKEIAEVKTKLVSAIIDPVPRCVHHPNGVQYFFASLERPPQPNRGPFHALSRILKDDTPLTPSAGRNPLSDIPLTSSWLLRSPQCAQIRDGCAAG